MHALPRIAEQPADQGFLTEALMAAIAQSAPEAKERVRAFLEGRAAKVNEGLNAHEHRHRRRRRATGPCASASRACVLREGADGVRYLRADQAAGSPRARA